MSTAVTPETMTRELLAWIAARPRSYREALDAWTSNCPRHPVWDDAVQDGLVAVADGSVRLTERGRAVLEGEGVS